MGGWNSIVCTRSIGNPEVFAGAREHLEHAGGDVVEIAEVVERLAVARAGDGDAHPLSASAPAAGRGLRRRPPAAAASASSDLRIAGVASPSSSGARPAAKHSLRETSARMSCRIRLRPTMACGSWWPIVSICLSARSQSPTKHKQLGEQPAAVGVGGILLDLGERRIDGVLQAAGLKMLAGGWCRFHEVDLLAASASCDVCHGVRQCEVLSEFAGSHWRDASGTL